MTTPLDCVTINIREKLGDGEGPYLYPSGGSNQVKLTREENPPNSGFFKFTHGPPSGGTLRVDKVTFGKGGQDITVDLGINSGDNIEHLTVWYWKDTAVDMTNPLLIEILQGDNRYTYKSAKAGGTSWQPLPIRQSPRPNPLTGKTLEIQLDGLNCSLNEAITVNLTFQNSENHKNGSYCCPAHCPQGTNGRVSVALRKVRCKKSNHRSADCYKHEFTPSNGWRVAAIKYDPTGGNTRNRINLNGQPISGVEAVYVLYCNRNPQLIYVDGGAATGWYKKPTSSDKDEQWQKVSTNLDGITPDNLTENMDCENWTKLKEALREVNCGNYQQCPTSGVKVTFAPSPSPPPALGAAAYPGPAASPSGTVVGPIVGLLGTLLRGALSGVSKVVNTEVIKNLAEIGVAESALAGQLGIEAINAALEAIPKSEQTAPDVTSPEAAQASAPPEPPKGPERSVGATILAGSGLYGVISGVFGGSGVAGFAGWKLYNRSRGDPWVRQI